MAATSEEQMNLLLSSFDQIYEDFKIGLNEINVFRSKSNNETSRLVTKLLKKEPAANERLKKLYEESLNTFADQLAHRTQCHSFKEALKKVNDENKSKEHEHRNALESLRQKHVTKVEELENKIRSLLVEKATNDMVNDRLRQDLAATKSHIQAMLKKLDRVVSEVECKYELEIQDLKDCLILEQEEKNDISNKLESLQKELVSRRASIAEKQRDTTSYRQVETLKQKLMKLRKENEILNGNCLLHRTVSIQILIAQVTYLSVLQ